jgi:hypothetical protein
MSDRPKFVEFREEGPREGFQIEKAIYPLADRAIRWPTASRWSRRWRRPA